MIRILVITFLSLWTCTLSSQESITAAVDSIHKRPKIGLTLSGGAAHGFAHIGVIRYLEEINMPIDYITGTSMGAVVGALKSMGYDSYRMEELSGELDWRILLSNTTPLDEITPSERRFAQKIPFSLIWRNDRIQLPQGLIGGQKLDLILNRLFCPAHFIEDFDSLRIPFRCVTTDLAEGSVHVQKEGYLGKAVRASMAIPSVFPPIEIDNRLMVDGGLIRNYPVQENIAMGADIVIGVNVGKEKFKKEELNSINTILLQAGVITNILDTEEQTKLVDINVRPDVKDKALFAFSEYTYFIEQGYKAAKAQAAEFKRLKDSLDVFDLPPPLEAIETPVDLLISEIRLNETDKYYAKLIQEKLNIQEGDRVSIYDIENGISDIYGTLNFAKVNYAFFNKEDGLGLEVNTELASPFTLGININRFKHYKTSLIFSGEVRNKLAKTSRLHYSLRASEKPGIFMNYQNRYEKVSNILLNVEAKWEKYDLPFHLDSSLDRIYKTYESYASAGFQHELSKHTLLDYHYKFMFDEFQPDILKADNFIRYTSFRQSAGIGLNWSSLSTILYPEKGINFDITADYIFQHNITKEVEPDNNFFDLQDDRKYASININASVYCPIAKRLVTETHVYLKYTSRDVFTDHTRFGGPVQGKKNQIGMVGFDDSELILASHVAVNQVIRKEVFQRFYIGISGSYVYGRNLLSYAYGIDKEISAYSGGALFAYATPLGPISFDFGISNLSEELEFNLGLGFRHIL